MGDTGLELESVIACGANDLRDAPGASAAESGAVGAAGDPALREVVTAWPNLSPAARSTITSLVRLLGCDK